MADPVVAFVEWSRFEAVCQEAERLKAQLGNEEMAARATETELLRVKAERDRLAQALRELPVEGNAAMLFAQNAALRGENTKLAAERNQLAEQGVRDRELLVMVTVERDRLRELVQHHSAERNRAVALLRQALPEIEYATAPMLRDSLSHSHDWVPEWLRQVRALVGEG